MLQHKYRELVRKHLAKLLDALFAELTGLHFHIAWTPAAPRHWDARSLPTGHSVCCQLSGSPVLPDCSICGQEQLARALSTDGNGHYFTCRLGVCNYWCPIRLRGETLGLAYLQALDHSLPSQPGSARSARVAPHRHPPADARVMDSSEFARAARLLRLIVRDVQTASLADLQRADLNQARQALRSLRTVYGRWRRTLSRVIPAFHRTPPKPGAPRHADQIVRHLLEYVDQHYAQPVTLKECAEVLRLNSAYLSAAFSRAMGIRFKTYLTELRVEKARDLLSDHTKSISEVASTVGYASEDRFRRVFKQVTGLPPRIWRETLQMPPRSAL